MANHFRTTANCLNMLLLMLTMTVIHATTHMDSSFDPIGEGRGCPHSAKANESPRLQTVRALLLTDKSDDDVSEEDSDTSFDYEADAMFQEGRDITLDKSIEVHGC
ncbi:unnamed protein product [Pleuronectes platessa]|uniref:Uncharacterized protein n=1 Tax=Pleuronectes platessa TaxID=8262 RepID=A0A9N7URG0_PLEPL|nr:unnamed protein product [Pleuronectes platessa]